MLNIPFIQRLQHITTAVLLCIGASAVIAASPNDSPHSPHLLYGEDASYIVTRGGAPAGTHRLAFRSDGDRLEVVAQTRATMLLLGLFDVPFIYDSRAVWENNALVTLSASFAKGGEPISSKVYQEDGEYRTGKGESAKAPLFPTNHWNAAVLNQTVIFNTLNGNLGTVSITKDGEESLNIGGEKTPTTRYRVAGDLDILLWYDDNGKWLQLRFSVLGSDYTFTYQPDNEPSAS